MGHSHSRGCKPRHGKGNQPGKSGGKLTPSPAVSPPAPCSEATRQLERNVAVISDLERKVADASSEAKKRCDLANVREQQKLALQLFLSSMDQLTFVDPLPVKLKHAWNVMVIGAVSAGKSSLLNKLYGLTLPVGVGDVTRKTAHVHTDGNLVVWDSPGCNQDWQFYDPDTLNFVHAMSLVVIVYRDSLLPLDNIVRVVHRIKGSVRMVCVRTQCDLFNVAGHTQALTLDQEMKRDKGTLSALGITGVRLFKTATAGPNEFDCPALKAAINHPLSALWDAMIRGGIR